MKMLLLYFYLYIIALAHTNRFYREALDASSFYNLDMTHATYN